jgi:hypothetical protein
VPGLVRDGRTAGRGSGRRSSSQHVDVLDPKTLHLGNGLDGLLVAGALVLAGCALALGGHLNQNHPFHDVSGLLVEPLRGWVPQLLCLPALARLAVSLWPFSDGGDP